MPRIISFEGKQQSFPDDATDAEISAALNAIPASNAKDAPKAKTWVADVLTGAAERLGKITDNPSQAAASTAGALATTQAVPLIGSAVRATGETLHEGAQILRGLLDSGDWTSKLAKLAIPKLHYAAPVLGFGGKALSVAGRTMEKLATAAEGAAADALPARLARIPLQGRLDQIGEQALVAPAPRATVESLPDDVALVRESIGMKMAPETAIRIVANGDKAYYDVLKNAFIQSLKEQGMPPPKPVADLMKLPAFQRLPKP